MGPPVPPSSAIQLAWAAHGFFVVPASPLQHSSRTVEDGASAHQFVEWFPGVTLEQTRTVLEHAARSALAAL